MTGKARLEGSLYCNTIFCIATVEQGQGWTVLQYSGQPSHDTAWAGRTGRRRGAGLGVRGAQWALGRAERHGRARAPRWAVRACGRWARADARGRQQAAAQRAGMSGTVSAIRRGAWR